MAARRLLRAPWGARGAAGRKHAGAVHPGALQLPPALARAAKILLQEGGWSRQQAEALRLRLWGRRPPDVCGAPGVSGARKRSRSPEPEVRVTAEAARGYLVARLARDYAAAGRALSEIQARAPDFAPRTLLDFGSGLGAACWAAQGAWGRSLQQFVCVEPSEALRELAERLRHGGGATPGPAHFGPVFLRPLLPPGPQAQWELVIGRRALEGLRGRGQRAQALRGLWGRTGGVLVLLENGTRAGHRALMEAREELLQGPDADSMEIFAPCPHRLPCPRLNQGRACAFAQSFWPLPLSGNPSAPERELVSFLVVRRRGSALTSPGDPVTSPPDPVTSPPDPMTSPPDPMTSPPGGWARVTAPVCPRPRHVSLSLCCPDGAQRRLAVTAARHGRSLYRQARASRWGDLLPFPGEWGAANGKGERR